jgi:predicted nucleic acid-binding protein
VIVMTGVTYDTGALVAADRDNREMWALHAGYLREEVVPMVPAPVLAQAWRGGARQARLARLLKMCDIEPLSEEQARDVGVLAGKAKHDDVVDVAVVEGAIRRGDAVVTSDAGHVRKIAAAADAAVWVEQV